MSSTQTGRGSAVGSSRRSSSQMARERTLTLSKPDDSKWKCTLTFTRPAQDQLVLEGTMGGHPVQMQLKLFDRDKLTLVNRGFHWINEVLFSADAIDNQNFFSESSKMVTGH
jgi:hypothetical protein